jgi:hypothetical protein
MKGVRKLLIHRSLQTMPTLLLYFSYGNHGYMNINNDVSQRQRI